MQITINGIKHERKEETISGGTVARLGKEDQPFLTVKQFDENMIVVNQRGGMCQLEYFDISLGNTFKVRGHHPY